MPKTPRLSEAEIEARLVTLPGWLITTHGELSRKFPQADFSAGLAFVNELAGAAEAADHHPDVLLTYPAVTITLTTHDSGGLTAKDFALAHQIQNIANRPAG